MQNIAASRKTLLQVKAKADGEETATTIKGGRQTSKNRSIKYVCPHYGAIIRATKEVNVVCGDCNRKYGTHASVHRAKCPFRINGNDSAAFCAGSTRRTDVTSLRIINGLRA
ncbi:MAG: hypothetical protein RRZ24_06025 [Clostridia bacterium]